MFSQGPSGDTATPSVDNQATAELMASLIQKSQNGTLTPADVQKIKTLDSSADLLDYNPATGQVSLHRNSWWSTWGPIVMAVGGIAAAGVIGGAISAAGAGGDGGGDIPLPGSGDTPTLEGTAAGPGATDTPTTGIPPGGDPNADVVGPSPGATPSPTGASVPVASTGDTGGGAAVNGTGGVGGTGGPVSAGSSLIQLANALGKAGTASGNNQLNAAQIDVMANNSNISGQSAYENELSSLDTQEAANRQTDLSDVMLNNYAMNRQQNPGDPTSVVVGPQALSTLGALGEQGAAALAKSPQYNATSQPTLPAYTPLNGPALTTPSTLQNIANIGAPVIAGAGALYNLYNSGANS